MMKQYEINSIFPTPVCKVKRNSELSIEEENEIEDIIKEGMYRSVGNSISPSLYIFNTGKLKKIKQFFEQQLKIYVEQVINPKEEVDFYITQSWLNINKPGEFHHNHYHTNSIISGVFYIATGEDDGITFVDPNRKVKEVITFAPKEYNLWNSGTWFIPTNNNELVMFPSWLNHKVDVNKKATTDRISLAFNTFARGILGEKDEPTELIL